MNYRSFCSLVTSKTFGNVGGDKLALHTIIFDVICWSLITVENESEIRPVYRIKTKRLTNFSVHRKFDKMKNRKWDLASVDVTTKLICDKFYHDSLCKTAQFVVSLVTLKCLDSLLNFSSAKNDVNNAKYDSTPGKLCETLVFVFGIIN